MIVATPAAGRRLGRWPVAICCHDDELSPLAPRPMWLRRPGHGPRVHCTHCGSVHPGLLYSLFGAEKPAAPTWRNRCPHNGHAGREGIARCEARRVAAAESWWGVTLAEPRGEQPRRFYVYTAAAAQMSFDARHLLDLNDAQFRAVARLLTWHTGVRYRRGGEGGLAHELVRHR